MLTSPQTLAARQLSELRSDVRLIVVHPNFVAQHTLMQRLDDGFIYVRFQGTTLVSDELWAQFAGARAEQADLGEGMIVLDECDRADADALVEFLRRLSTALPAARIYLLTRYLPLKLLQDAALRPLTALVPVAEEAMLWDYSQRLNNPTKLLEVYALGAGRVFVDGRLVQNWDGVLPRALFFYLIDRGMVTRQEIFETFWPNLPVREATNVFHVTKRKINEVLQTDLTMYGSGYYHIAPHLQLSYDVSLFNLLVQDALVASPDEAEVRLMQALSLYHGEFLSPLNFEWVKPRRANMRMTFCEALAALGRVVQDRGDDRRALQFYLRATTMQRTRQDIVESVVRLYAGLNMPAEARQCLDNLKAELARTQAGDLLPSLQAFGESLRV